MDAIADEDTYNIFKSVLCYTYVYRLYVVL